MARSKTHEEFVKEVYDLVGDEYTILGKYKACGEHILIKHNKCHETYGVAPSKFLQGRRCPLCATNALISTDAYKIKLKSLVGDEYEIAGEYTGTNVKTEFIHKKCGRSIYMTPYQINSGKQCRHCFREGIAIKYKKDLSVFKNEVCELTDGEYIVVGDNYINAHTYIDILHNTDDCGYKWGISPHNFLQGNRCPKCKASKGEVAIFNFLTKTGVDFSTQHRFKECFDVMQLPFDFAVFKNGEIELLIEYDGQQHFEPVGMWGGIEGFSNQIRRDGIKNDFCEQNNIEILRIPYWEIDNIDKIVFDKLVDVGFLEEVGV